MTTRNSTTHSLTDLQQAILDFIWSAGSATAEQVREGLLPEHPLKVFVYQAELPSRSLAARAVRQIIQRFCSGSVEQFLVGMVDEEVLPLDEIQRLVKKVRHQK
jgi:BlaI family penicillinase repressor